MARQPCGFQNSVSGLDLGFLRGSFVVVDEAVENRLALDPFLGEASGRMVGPGRAECLAAVVRRPF